LTSSSTFCSRRDWSEPHSVIRHFSSSIQNAYTSEELNGLLYYQNSLFSASEGFAPWLPDQGLCPRTPLRALPPDPRYRLALRALHVVPPVFRRNRRHCLAIQQKQNKTRLCSSEQGACRWISV